MMESLFELWQSLSSELQGAVVGGLGGGLVGGILSIVGVIAGALLGRLLRRLGKIRCAFEQWNLDVDYQPPSFSFIGKFFNEKDEDIGLRDVSVVFYRGRKEMETAELYFGHEAALHPDGRPGGTRFREEYTGQRAEALNLPAGQWHSRPLRGSVKDKQGLQGCGRAVFRGYLPKGKRFEREIARL
jgi:hypothetical protein